MLIIHVIAHLNVISNYTVKSVTVDHICRIEALPCDCINVNIPIYWNFSPSGLLSLPFFSIPLQLSIYLYIISSLSSILCLPILLFLCIILLGNVSQFKLEYLGEVLIVRQTFTFFPTPDLVSNIPLSKNEWAYCQIKKECFKS